MIIANKLIYSNLAEILPTYYEKFEVTNPIFPCISYMENGNAAREEGDTIFYSSINYTVRLYAENLSDLEEYLNQIDSKMRELGFKRLSANELVVGNIIQKILVYEALAIEKEA